MTERAQYKVLLVEDNRLDARTITKVLTHEGDCVVAHVEDLASGLDAVARDGFDCVLLDLSLPDSEGLVSVETMVARSPHCPVVVLTGLDDPAVAVEAVERGAQDYLVKNTMTPELVIRAIGYAVARHSAETELMGANERLTSMRAREKIARDLHDTVIQRLFATGMTLQAATRVSSHDELADRALLVVDEIDEAIRELRAAIFGLNSPDDGESFAVAVINIAAGFLGSLGFEPVVRLGNLPPVPDPIARDALAVVREALSNVARHAHATMATLTVVHDGDVLTVRVTDNGNGTLDVQLDEESSPGLSGNGLVNMRARAEAHGGTMHFDAAPNAGSELSWSVPLHG